MQCPGARAILFSKCHLQVLERQRISVPCRAGRGHGGGHRARPGHGPHLRLALRVPDACGVAVVRHGRASAPCSAATQEAACRAIPCTQLHIYQDSVPLLLDAHHGLVAWRHAAQRRAEEMRRERRRRRERPAGWMRPRVLALGRRVRARARRQSWSNRIMRDMRLRMIWAQENSAVSEFRATRYMGELMATATQQVRSPRPRPRPLADRRGCSARGRRVAAACRRSLGVVGLLVRSDGRAWRAGGCSAGCAAGSHRQAWDSLRRGGVGTGRCCSRRQLHASVLLRGRVQLSWVLQFAQAQPRPR